jgi:hypothetical protein
MYADLFFDLTNAENLDTAASTVFRELGITEFNERESSNYVDGRYFVAQHGGLTYEIAYSDDEDAGAMRFWLSIEGEVNGEPQLDELVDAIARTKLQAAGAQVARVYDLGKKTMKVVSY